jgi:hypothetical protein
MLAAVTKVPELACEHAESKALAEAVAEVAKHYPNQLIDPVMMAWFNLALVGGTFYGSRAIVARERMRAENAEKRGRGSAVGGNVVPLPIDPNSIGPTAPGFNVPSGAHQGPLNFGDIKPGKLQG